MSVLLLARAGVQPVGALVVGEPLEMAEEPLMVRFPPTARPSCKTANGVPPGTTCTLKTRVELLTIPTP